MRDNDDILYKLAELIRNGNISFYTYSDGEGFNITIYDESRKIILDKDFE